MQNPKARDVNLKVLTCLLSETVKVWRFQRFQTNTPLILLKDI